MTWSHPMNNKKHGIVVRHAVV